MVWYKPLGEANQYPSYANLKQGDDLLREVMGHIMNSPIWNKRVVIVTFDEHGGWWDHVAPPNNDPARKVSDRWGPGSRIPAIVVSPFARRGYFDHQTYDQTVILKLIEDRHHLGRLGTRDAAQPDLWRSLNFQVKKRLTNASDELAWFRYSNEPTSAGWYHPDPGLLQKGPSSPVQTGVR